MRAQVGELDAARVRLQKELVSLTCQNTELKAQVVKLPKIEALCRSLKKKYNGALEMAGEKSEEVEVMHSEMAQVKEVFQMQLVGLMEELEASKLGVGPPAAAAP